MGDRLDGHLVQGHVDGVGSLSSIEHSQESIVLWVTAPQDLSRYIATKGSITLNGVSLTVNEIDHDRFRVNIVPYTADETLLPSLKSGSSINIEVDVLARYVERLIGASEGLSLEKLRGFGMENPYSSR